MQIPDNWENHSGRILIFLLDEDMSIYEGRAKTDAVSYGS